MMRLAAVVLLTFALLWAPFAVDDSAPKGQQLQLQVGAARSGVQVVGVC